MALRATMTLDSGLVATDAFFRAEHFQGTKVGMVLTVRGYATEENYNNWTNHIYLKAFDFVPTVTDADPNIVKQAYEYLKTLPEFAESVDF